MLPVVDGRCLVAVQRGDGEAALREAQLEPDESYSPLSNLRLHNMCVAIARPRTRLWPISSPTTEGLAYQIAEVYAVRGEKDKAFEWLQIAFDNHDTGMLALLVDPLLRSLSDDPRYKALLAKMNFPAT